MKVKTDQISILQFMKFILVGCINAVVMLAVYYIFVWVNPEWFLVGNIVGWVASVANAYMLNQKFTFKNMPRTKRETVKKLGKTYLSYGATFCLSTVLLWLEVDTMGWSRLLCPVFNFMITTPINFWLNKFWTFR